MRAAVADGADALAAAGGDGTQALIASIAAEHDLPFACIPAGTRNHLALDLGVDRDDVVGALDAFVAGGERRVDLAEVNGRTFVNNVSLGLYAEAVQREGYREAKLRTILDTAPDIIGTDGSRAPALQLDRPGRSRARFGRGDPGVEQRVPPRPGDRLRLAPPDRRRPAGHRGGAGARGRRRAAGAGSGASGPRRASRWAPGRRFPAGVDGEALTLEPPLRFTSVPAYCGCGSPRTTPAPHRRRRCPRGCGTASRLSSPWPPAELRTPTRLLVFSDL